MGEYAQLGGVQVKIGTCEDMYYLRWEDRKKVAGYEFDDATLAAVRFRFPFPSEDGIAPGDFEDHDKGLTLWGFEQPADVDHGSVQFSARNGYLISLPCPEGPDTLQVHRNGYGGPCSLVQQAWRGGRLVGIVKCNGCGARYRLDEGYEDAAALSIRSQADDQYKVADQNGTEGNRAIGRELHETADRLLAGYGVKVGEES